jgi:hypothetical protein
VDNFTYRCELLCCTHIARCDAWLKHARGRWCAAPTATQHLLPSPVCSKQQSAALPSRSLPHPTSRSTALQAPPWPGHWLLIRSTRRQLIDA